MDHSQLPTLLQRLEFARESRSAGNIGEVRLLRTSPGGWLAHLITSQSMRSWLVYYKAFSTLPSGNELAGATLNGQIMHPDTAAELYPELAHLQYEARATEQGVVRLAVYPNLEE